jgi:hypothetical protein
MSDLKCNQDGCDAPAVARYTWPGRPEAGACLGHVAQLKLTAHAMGFDLQVLPVEQQPPAAEEDGDGDG